MTKRNQSDNTSPGSNTHINVLYTILASRAHTNAETNTNVKLRNCKETAVIGRKHSVSCVHCVDKTTQLQSTRHK